MSAVERDDSRVFELDNRFAELVIEFKALDPSQDRAFFEKQFEPIVKVIKDLQFIYGRSASQAEAIALEASARFRKYLDTGKDIETACDYVVLWVLMKELEFDLVALFKADRPVEDILRIAECNLEVYMEKLALIEFAQVVLPKGAALMHRELEAGMPVQKVVKDYLNEIKHALGDCTRSM